MAKVKASKAHDNGTQSFTFKCPGCCDYHTVNSTWQFNGDLDKPTFSPSILLRTGHYAKQFDPAKDTCWCTYNAEHSDDASPFTCGVCHSFVTDGRIQYLDDCTHELAGQTIELPRLEEIGEDW